MNVIKLYGKYMNPRYKILKNSSDLDACFLINNILFFFASWHFCEKIMDYLG